MADEICALPPLSSEQAELAARFDRACGGWSNRRLAPHLGVNHESLRRYRAGRAAIPVQVAARLCEFMKVSPGWLLLGETAGDGRPAKAAKLR